MKQKTQKQKQNLTEHYNDTKLSKINIFLCLLFSIIVGLFHINHLEILFENDKHFSHLSNLEREMSFRTEAGLYYYYFKSLVADQNYNHLNDSLINLINHVMINDNRTEYPSTINSLNRFNLYPEIFVAFLYRTATSLNLLSKTCWQVSRDEDGMPPIESCEGLLEPIYFYSKFIFVLNGFSPAFLFILCWLLNDYSLLSGLIGCLCYFYNHSEATRVMWTPALRESFSFPFHLLQMISLTILIKSNLNKFNEFVLSISILINLLTWQFSQFSLATQTLSLFLTYSIGFLPKYKLIAIIRAKTLALVVCFILMFANKMLITSLFSSLLCSIWIICSIETKFNSKSKVFNLFLRLILLLVLICVFKSSFFKYLIQSKDDSHIWDILKSKFNSSFRTFDTSLYLCSREFDFIDSQTLIKLTKTCLIPISGLVFIFYGIILIEKFVFYNDNEIKNTDSLICYNSAQLVAYSIMALLIMRLKLFWTPHLCIYVSFLAQNRKEYNFFELLFEKIFRKNNFNKNLIIILVLGVISYQGLNNLKLQRSTQGQYSDYSMEKMIVWINNNTFIDDTFVGSMPTMANVKLSTNRPIANHPHYEHEELRERVRKIYSLLYGYRDVYELSKLVKNKLQAKYLILEAHLCRSFPKDKPECGMANIAHIGLEKTSSKQACMHLLEQNVNAVRFFKKVFENKNYFVFRII
jgi:hypothetical protein